jgi:hypothetical protein
MTAIVRYAHRYKHPPRKRKPVALEVPAVVRAGKRTAAGSTEAAARVSGSKPPLSGAEAGQGNPTTSSAANRESAIVTVRSRKAATIPPGLLPETPEDHKRRGEATAAMRREMVRRVCDGRY